MISVDTLTPRAALMTELFRLEDAAILGRKNATSSTPDSLKHFLVGEHGATGIELAQLALPKFQDALLVQIHVTQLAGRLAALDTFCKAIEQQLASQVIASLLQGPAGIKDLCRCLDELTPHYLPRIDGLSPQMQRLLLTFASPLADRFIESVSEASTYSRIPKRSASIGLLQLNKLDFLDATEDASGNVLYKIKDVALHAWLIMRHSYRRKEHAFDLLAKQVKTDKS